MTVFHGMFSNFADVLSEMPELPFLNYHIQNLNLAFFTRNANKYFRGCFSRWRNTSTSLQKNVSRCCLQEYMAVRSMRGSSV